jgi:hypothetical protein
VLLLTLLGVVSAVVEDVAMAVVTLETETETEICETETGTATFETIAMHPHSAATWTGTGVAATVASTLEMRPGWALAAAVHAPPHATSAT